MSHPAGGESDGTSVVQLGTTSDGVRQLRRTWPVDDPVAICVIAHGINEHSGRYERLGTALAEARIQPWAYDHRGYGESGGPRGDVAEFEVFVDDLADLIEAVRVAGLPLVLLGHSMGGLIALRYVLRGSPAPDVLVLSSPALGDAAPAWMHGLARPLAAVAPRLRLPSPFPTSYLSSDPAVCEAFDADPLISTTTSIRLGYSMFATMEWVRAHVGELTVPTLVTHGQDDKMVPTRHTVELGQVPGVERRVLEGLRHEPYQESEGPLVIADVVRWILDNLPDPAG